MSDEPKGRTRRVTYRLDGVRVPIDQGPFTPLELARACLGEDYRVLKNAFFIRRSLDARRKNSIVYDCSLGLEIEASDEDLTRLEKAHGMKPYVPVQTTIPEPGLTPLKGRIVVVGAGPCGLFCAHRLASAGFRPLLLERGREVALRAKDVETFWERGILNEESNVQFGEGGAGTFSDGKLTTRSAHPLISYVMDTLVDHGAPGEIRYDKYPHLGTDRLREIIVSLRRHLIAAGSEVRFESKVTGLLIEGGRVRSVQVNSDEWLDAEAVVLAIGHSARDTYEMLDRSGVSMQPKAFAVGVRIEHLQRTIDLAQYGQRYAGHRNLAPAQYQLTYSDREYGRSCYSFCMCPGGLVIASASEPGGVVTNGMSYHARDLENANSALVVSVNRTDFAREGALAGIEFQRELESRAFRSGGGGYRAPVQMLGDFLLRRASKTVDGRIEPTYRPGVTPADLGDVLPREICTVLHRAIRYFGSQVAGFDAPDSVLTGVETRTSAPVRILRGEDMVSMSTDGLYPAGEGAGYSGGIVSSAVDGIRVADAIIARYRPS